MTISSPVTCPNCKSLNENGAVKCRACGSPLPDIRNRPTVLINTTWTLLVWVFLLQLLGAGGGLIAVILNIACVVCAGLLLRHENRDAKKGGWTILAVWTAGHLLLLMITFITAK